MFLFTVSIIIGEGDTGENARAKVIFHGIDDAVVATYYVKNSDVLLPADGVRVPGESYIEDIVVDPGIGGILPSGQFFVGWYIWEPSEGSTTPEGNYTTKTEHKTIEDIREYLSTLSITENDEVHIFAMIFKVFSITYLDEDNISLGTDDIYLLLSENTAPYTISHNYTPSDSTKNFEGWLADRDSYITNAVYEGESVSEPYKLGTTMTISGSITFTVDAPKGNWLVFDENAKGATYIAPQFVRGDSNTVAPTKQMQRLGYTFKGWYTEKYADDQVADESKKFEFGSPITEETIIYAKWEVVENANYSVIFWEQNVDGTGYDFAGSDTKNGPVNTAINASVNDAETMVTVRAGNNTSTHTVKSGFSFDHADTGKTIAPEGNTIVNVYINRNTYTLTFQVPEYTRTTSNNGDQYGIYNEEYVPIYYNNNNGRWYRTRTLRSNWQGYYYEYSNQYNGNRYIISNWSTIKTITALYGQNISDEFPIVGSNGVTYPTGTRWMPQGALNVDDQQYFTENVVVAYIDRMTPGSMTLRWNHPENRTDKTMVYWIETIDNTPSSSDVATRTYKGTLYEEYKTVVAKYNGITVEDYINLDGFVHFEADQPLNYTSGDTTYYGDGSVATLVNFYFTREKYAYNFNDGGYFNGNNNPLTDDYTPTGHLTTKDNIIYGSDTSSYNKGGANYYEPACEYPGFVLEGWYLDNTCTMPYTFTTMPKGGVTLYAKWRQIQYRVFLHPNSYYPDKTLDTSLSWGDELLDEDKKQAMNFRISYMDTVSVPTGLRDEYEFIGWYLDEATTIPFNDNSKLTENIVTSAYDKTDPANYTDKMNKYGLIEGTGWNSDLIGWDDDNNPETPGKDRFWITNKLDLYGKWSAILTGAQGVTVVYDANGGTLAPGDSRKYKDNVKAIAQAASVAPENEQFLYWVVQKWNGTEYVDTEVKVYPGDTFTVWKNDAKVIDLTPEDEEYVEGNIYKAYIVQLRAEYGPVKPADDTHITWYANGGEMDQGLPAGEDVVNQPATQTSTYIGLAINEAVAVAPANTFKRPGYKFLGWAKKRSPENAFDDVKKEVNEGAYTPLELTEDDLWLKYVETDGVGKFYLKDEKAAEGTDPWKIEITHVAADENLEYDSLYAVWEAYYYVFRSGTGVLEAHKLPKDTTATVDLTAKYETDNTYLYGGYYLDVTTTTSEEVDGEAVETQTTTYGYGPYHVSDADMKAAVEDKENDFIPATAVTYNADKTYYSGLKKWWNVANAGLAKGTELKPEAGKVYYVKEVPSKYLTNRLQYVYNWKYENKISRIYLLTVVDDKLYSNVYFKLTINGDEVKQAQLAGAFTYVQETDTDYKVTTHVTDFANVKRGFIGWVDSTFTLGGDGFITPDTEFTVHPYWVTYDGVEVYGTARTFNTGDGKHGSITEVTNP